MYFVGLDVHQRHTSICILDANGVKLKQGQLRGPWSLIAEELKTLPGSVAVCYEASCGYGFLHDLLAQVADRVVVAHPGQLRLIFRSKRKNDRADAEKLAKAAWQGVRRSPTIRQHFERIGQGSQDRKKIALVVTAHYLARVMHAMLRQGEAWKETSRVA